MAHSPLIEARGGIYADGDALLTGELTNKTAAPHKQTVVGRPSPRNVPADRGLSVSQLSRDVITRVDQELSELREKGIDIALTTVFSLEHHACLHRHRHLPPRRLPRVREAVRGR